MSNERKFTIEYLDEYIRQGEPDKIEKAYIWQTAIGLQKEMPSFDWVKGHSGVLLSNDVVEKLDKQWEEE